MEQLQELIKGFPLPAIGAALLVGLLLGWLAIGWWLWPVGWTEADPWDLRPEYQEQYVSLVARAYSRTPDLARRALGGWESASLRDVLVRLQDRAADSETRQQLADLGVALGLPRGEAEAATAPAPGTPLLRSRLATVCLTGLAGLAVVVLLIFAASTRPWVSILAARRRPARASATRSAEPASGHFASTYVQGQEDFGDFFPLEAPDGQFLGECGLSIARTLGQRASRGVTALEMVLFDAFDHRTETRILMSRYAQGDRGLSDELITHGELIPIEPGAQAVVETTNLRLLATITDLRYADQEPREGIFQRVVVALDVMVKQIPSERAAADDLDPAQTA